MQLDEEQVVKVFNYFKKINKMRCGDWVTEMRRSIAISLRSQGVSLNRVGKILHVDHSTVVHYEKISPREDTKDVVAENMWSWIDGGMYPMTAYINGGRDFSYRLTDEPHKKHKWSHRIPKEVEPKKLSLDELIDSL